MYKRLFPRMAFCLALITSFLFMPFSAVYADGLTQGSEYWKWWYIKNTTDAITDGQGASADNLTDTYNGSTVGQYVYDQTGLTAEDIKDYVQQQYDNATGYVEHTAEWYSSAIDDIWNSSIDVGTKAKYQAEKALRETVDTAGKTVVNVSSSGYWNNVYNDIFNSGGYKNQYEQTSDNSYKVSVNGQNYNISLAGFGYAYGDLDSVVTNGYSKFNQGLSGDDGKNEYFVFSVVGNGKTVYVNSNNSYGVYNQWQVESAYNFRFSYDRNYTRCDFNFLGSDHTRVWDNSVTVYFSNNINDGQSGGTPVLQPKQVGYVMHNGIKYPVYNDPSLNPFKINDNGTVSWNDGSGDEPIYVDPTQLTDDGSLDILEWLDNDDQTQNPYNPQGQPWNTQPDGSALGGFFSNLIKDISSIFDGIGKAISNLIDKVIKAIKDIANIIIDALKQFWNLLIGDIDGYSELFETDVNDNFDMISDLYDLLLECMGVDV